MLGSWTGLLAPRSVAPAPSTPSPSADGASCSASPATTSGPTLHARAWWIQDQSPSDVLVQHVDLDVSESGVLRLAAVTGGGGGGGEAATLVTLHLGGLHVVELDSEDGGVDARSPSPPPPQQPSTLRRLLFPRTAAEPAATGLAPATANKWALSRLALARPGGGEPLLVLAADTEADHRRLAAGLAAAAAAHPQSAAAAAVAAPAASRPGSARAPSFPPGLTAWSSAGPAALWDAVSAGLGPDGAPYPRLPPGVYDAGLRLLLVEPVGGPRPRSATLSAGVPYYCVSNGHTYSRAVVREFLRTVLHEPGGGRMPLTVGMPPADHVPPPAFDAAAVNVAHRALAARRRRGLRTVLADRAAAARAAARARAPGEAAPARLYHSYAGRPAL